MRRKKLLRDFEIQTDPQISSRRLDLIIINNNNKKDRTWIIMDIAVPTDHRVKLKEWEERDKYLNLTRELKRLWNMKVTMIPTVIGALHISTNGSVEGLEDLEITGLVSKLRHCWDRPEYWEESWRLERTFVTQTSVRNHQLSLVRKTQKREQIIMIIIIIIIIIISCWQHGYPWPSLATPPYRSSP